MSDPSGTEFALQVYLEPPTAAKCTAFWAEVFGEGALTPDQTYSDRIRVCYRLTRELAYWKGIVTANQTLGMGTEIEPNPWHTPTQFYANAAPMARRAHMTLVQTTPLPLQPPPKSTNRKDYDAEKDRSLLRWCRIMGRLARKLNVGATKEGRRGLKWLLEPHTVRDMWIRPEILIAWENILLSEFLDAQIDKGVYEGQVALRLKFGLSAMEAKVLGDLARIAAPDIAQDNLETKKAMMELRIDKFMRRARREEDLRAELQALKLLATIQGLHKAEPEDDLKGMISVVAEVSEQADKEQIDDIEDA